MTSVLKNLMCRLLVVTTLLFPFQGVQAGMIGAELANAAAVQADRNVVAGFLNRSQVVEQFQALGLDVQAARDRVGALSDDEVGSIAGKVQELPAGGYVGLLLLILLIILIVVLMRR